MGVIGDLGVVKLITFVFFHLQCDRCQSLDKALEVRARGGAYYDVCEARGPALTIVNSTPLLFLHCALQVRCSQWSYQCFIETVNQALLCMM